MIAACVLGYALCSLAAGYTAGRLGIEDPVDRGGAVIILSVLGPCGLVLASSVLAGRHGQRHAEISATRHRIALAELQQQEREIAKLLRGDE